MKIILAAGGSGGHIFPSIALAKELEKAGAGDIYFVSSKRRLDRNILSGCGHKCFHLSVNPMPHRSNPLRMAVFAFKLLADSLFSLYIIAKVRPDAVVGFGGYSSGAVLLCAGLFKIPVLVHEQNLLPGRANVILSRLADRVAVSFKETAKYFPAAGDKVVFAGNPLRRDVLSGDRISSIERLDLSPDRMTVLIMGGSQGSSFLNRTASEAALNIKKEQGDAIQFVHLTGEKDFDGIRDFYETNGIPGRVFPFLERIEDAYAASDVAISRSGAAAVFELACYSRPMILVPYPNPKNNQRTNAKYFAKHGAAVYREERELSPDDLTGEILGMLTDGEKREKYSSAAGALSVPDAAERLAREVMELAKK